MSRRATAIAHSNIALVKYWGKRADVDPGLNLPAVGSISVTLDALSTKTSVEFDGALSRDELSLRDADGRELGEKPAVERVSRFLDLVRRQAGLSDCARVVSENDFPTGAGLASSASGFAALAVAATGAAGLDLERAELAALARRGSGSAARSLRGGFVELEAGRLADGTDCRVRQLAEPSHWELAVLVVLTSTDQKSVGSRAGMARTAQSSPYYDGWVASHAEDLAVARRAIAARDLQRLGEIAEHSCLKMHGLMMSARPPLLYWNSATVAVIDGVRGLRDRNTAAYFTIDAGPQVKVICAAADSERIAGELGEIPGVVGVIGSRLGAGARLLDR